MSDIINIRSSTIEHKVLNSCSAIIAAFFPSKKISIYSERDLAFQETRSAELSLEINTGRLSALEVCLKENNIELDRQKIEPNSPLPAQGVSLPGKEPLFQILVKRALFIFLERYTGRIIPWGILTGIRPGKLLRKMEELGLKQEIQTRILTELYMVSEEKAQLLQAVAGIQRPYLQKFKERPDLVSVYLTIPFCPSRCFYCSFPSLQLAANNRGLLENYLEALIEEVRLTGQMMKEMGLLAHNIYIGGGTPTILEKAELETLLQVIEEHIGRDEQTEYTVEAGRPDTIDAAKLLAMKKFGVNRLSINPQSMQDKTLRKIGRNHRVSDILKCYGLAREISDWIINMDLIWGLPEEGLSEAEDSLKRVLDLKPDNLTVHALALKRGSKAWDEDYNHSSLEDWQGIQHYLEPTIRAHGLKPYYLYRQKNIAGNLENVGYTLEGKECRYNIAIIEEQQTILGLGAGAASKILQGETGHLNLYNPLGITHYLTGFQKVHLRRKSHLQDRQDFLAKK